MFFNSKYFLNDKAQNKLVLSQLDSNSQVLGKIYNFKQTQKCIKFELLSF